MENTGDRTIATASGKGDWQNLHRRLTLGTLLCAAVAGTAFFVMTPRLRSVEDTRETISLFATANACDRASYSFWSGCDCEVTNAQTSCLINFEKCGPWDILKCKACTTVVGCGKSGLTSSRSNALGGGVSKFSSFGF